MEFIVTFLKDYTEYVTALAKWSFETCSKYNPQATRKNQIEKFRQHCNIDRLPLSLIALTGNNELVGMCSLRENDGVRQDLTPWLGSLYVLPTYRKHGVGKKLVEATKRVATRLNFNSLYLLAFDSDLSDYSIKQGWSLIGADTLSNLPVSIMQITLPPTPSPSDQWP